MPLKSSTRGTRKVIYSSVDSSDAKRAITGDISSLHALVARFEKEFYDLRKRTVHATDCKHIDDATRRLRMISLLDEFSALAEQETALSRETRKSTRVLHAILISSLAQSGVVKPGTVPDTAPELWRNRANKKENPAEFIRRVYHFCLEQLALHDLRRLDFNLYNSLSVWRAKGNLLPNDLHLPTKKEVNDKALQERGFTSHNLDPEAREALRLFHIHESRRRKPRGRFPK